MRDILYLVTSNGRINFMPFILFLLLLGFVTGCNLNNSSSNQGALQIRMVDSPAHYDAVLVDIQKVEVQNQADPQTWITLSTQAAKINLMKLTNGIYTVLGDSLIDAGTYHNIRITFGSGSQIIENGKTAKLNNDSSIQSGMVIDSAITVDKGYRTVMLLDFDVSKSIIKSGSGTYTLKPVIHAIDYSTIGAVSGTILPIKAHPVVYGIQGNDTLAATMTDTTTGDFILLGLKGGSATYNIAMVPTDSTYKDTTISGVQVTTGQKTDLQTIAVPQK